MLHVEEIPFAHNELISWRASVVHVQDSKGFKANHMHRTLVRVVSCRGEVRCGVGSPGRRRTFRWAEGTCARVRVRACVCVYASAPGRPSGAPADGGFTTSNMGVSGLPRSGWFQVTHLMSVPIHGVGLRCCRRGWKLWSSQAWKGCVVLCRCGPLGVGPEVETQVWVVQIWV